jgi:hypothetical protein
MARRVAALWAVLSLSGCFLFEPFPEFDAGVPEDGPDAGAVITVPRDPLKATGTLDTARAATGSFGWDAGGTLTVTAANGAVFTLDVPATSLTEQTVITMTPYATLDTGLGEESFGVKLEPEGLQATTTFMTLTVTPPAGATWPIDQQVPFSVQGTANVVSLAPLDKASMPMKLLLAHFSSYGLALAKKGFSASVEGVRNRLGGDLESQLETELSIALSAERRRALQGSQESNDYVKAFNDYLARYITQVANPRIAEANFTCANAKLAIQTALSLQRMSALLTLDISALNFQLTDLLHYNVVCMKEEFQLCRDNHIVTRIVPYFLGMLRQQSLLGAGDELLFNADRQTCEDYVRKCLKFSLSMDSDAIYTTGTGIDSYTLRESVYLPNAAPADYVTSVHDAPTDLTFILATGAIISGAPTPFTSNSYSAQYTDSCRTVSDLSRMGGQLGVASLAFVANEGDPAMRATVKDMYVVPALVQNTSSYTLTERMRDTTAGCTGTPRVSTVRDNWSSIGWEPWFSSLPTTNADSYISGWTIEGNSTFATKSVRWTGPNGNTFNARFVINHVPARE